MSCKSFDDYHRRITAYGCQNGTITATYVDTETKGMHSVFFSGHSAKRNFIYVLTLTCADQQISTCVSMRYKIKLKNFSCGINSNYVKHVHVHFLCTYSGHKGIIKVPGTTSCFAQPVRCSLIALKTFFESL